MSCAIFRFVIINIASVCKMDFFSFGCDAGSIEFPFIVSFYVRRESTS